jgi:hypothetical protein
MATSYGRPRLDKRRAPLRVGDLVTIPKRGGIRCRVEMVGPDGSSLIVRDPFGHVQAASAREVLIEKRTQRGQAPGGHDGC